jgi:cobalt-zinc-cadmium efflux system protein
MVHHGHQHGDGSALGHHDHALGGEGVAFAAAAILNIGFVAAEAFVGIAGHSVALLADAGHNLGDVLGLLTAWGASLLVRRAPTTQFTYGWRSSSILAALTNAIILFVAVGGIAAEAINRLSAPEPVAGGMVMIVAAVGIVINGASAFLFGATRRHADLNLRAVFVHMLSDMAVSAGIVIAGAIILVTHWFWLDPAVSLIVAAAILIGSWRLLRDSVNMALAGVPLTIDPQAVRDYLGSEPGVVAVHDLHIWPMSTTETALTCHLVMPVGHSGDALLTRIADTLRGRFSIGHVTIQIESGDPAHPCVLVPDHVV